MIRKLLTETKLFLINMLLYLIVLFVIFCACTSNDTYGDAAYIISRVLYKHFNIDYKKVEKIEMIMKDKKVVILERSDINCILEKMNGARICTNCGDSFDYIEIKLCSANKIDKIYFSDKLFFVYKNRYYHTNGFLPPGDFDNTMIKIIRKYFGDKYL